jgi:ATP-dependent 26S proteasome regulatory subunit
MMLIYIYISSIHVALLRPGRFDQVLHVPLPDLEARAEIFALHSKSIPLASDVNMKTLASLTEGCSGKSIIGNNV